MLGRMSARPPSLQSSHASHPSLAAPLAINQIRRLIALRWVSVGLMCVVAVALPPLLGLVIPLRAALAVALALAACNLLTLAWVRHGATASSVGVLVQLLIDLAGWSAFVYFTGGAANPLISLLLPILAIGAAVLPAALLAVLATSAVAAYSLLWHVHVPIHLVDPQAAARLHLAGMWATFAVSALAVTVLVSHMTRALRERDRALALAAEVCARDRHILALASLAAGAAHSLGTPLGTMRLLVDELKRDARLPADVQADVGLLDEQIEHCRETLGRLTAQGGDRRAEGGRRRGVADWIRETVALWRAQRPHVQPMLRLDTSLEWQSFIADETLAQALANLVDNAANVSPDAVCVSAVCRAGQLVIEVVDRGPGIPPARRALLGHAPVEAGAAGMGVGLYLAQAAVARAGGQLVFLPGEEGGTLVRMEFPIEGPPT